MSQESALIPSDYNKRSKESRKTSDSVFDRIYKYYYNSKTRIELDDEEEQIRSRWEAAWFLLIRAQTNKQVSDALCRMFAISQSTAYDDVKNAMNLFGGDPRANLKTAKRAIAESMALRCLSFAEQRGDMFMMNKFLDKYISINGLKDKGGDAKLEDLIKKLKPTQVILSVKKEELEADAKEKLNVLVKAMEEARKKHERET